MTAHNSQLHLVVHITPETGLEQRDGWGADTLADGHVVVYEDVPSALAAQPDKRIIVLTETPVRNLARRLVADGEPRAALRSWQEETAVLMAACRKARRHVFLLTWDSFLEGNTESLQALEQVAGQEITAFMQRLTPDFPAPPDAVSTLFAGVLLSQDSTANALLHEIEAMLAGPAMSTGLSEAIIIDAFEQIKNAARSEARMQSDLEGMLGERDLLQKSLATLQETVEGLEEQASQVLPLKEHVAKQTDYAAALLAERDLLRVSLSDAQAQLETQTAHMVSEQDAYRVRLAELQTEMNQKSAGQVKAQTEARQAHQKELDALATEQDLLRGSLLGMQNLNADLLSENIQAKEQLVELQMLKVSQDALERRCRNLEKERGLGQSVLGALLLDDAARLREAEARATEARNAFATVTDEKVREQSEHAQILKDTQEQQAQQTAALEERIKEKEERVSYLSAELDKIHGSNSWRLTSPMRNARAKLNKGKS